MPSSLGLRGTGARRHLAPKVCSVEAMAKPGRVACYRVVQRAEVVGQSSCGCMAADAQQRVAGSVGCGGRARRLYPPDPRVSRGARETAEAKLSSSRGDGQGRAVIGAASFAFVEAVEVGHGHGHSHGMTWLDDMRRNTWQQRAGRRGRASSHAAKSRSLVRSFNPIQFNSIQFQSLMSFITAACNQGTYRTYPHHLHLHKSQRQRPKGQPLMQMPMAMCSSQLPCSNTNEALDEPPPARSWGLKNGMRSWLGE